MDFDASVATFWNVKEHFLGDAPGAIRAPTSEIGPSAALENRSEDIFFGIFVNVLILGRLLGFIEQPGDLKWWLAKFFWHTQPLEMFAFEHSL